MFSVCVMDQRTGNLIRFKVLDFVFQNRYPHR